MGDLLFGIEAALLEGAFRGEDENLFPIERSDGVELIRLRLAVRIPVNYYCAPYLICRSYRCQRFVDACGPCLLPALHLCAFTRRAREPLPFFLFGDRGADVL